MIPGAVWLLAAQAAIFVPPLDVPLRVVTERVHSGAERIAYRTERLVRFRRDGIGYVAEVRILAASAEAPGSMAAMFEAGYSGLIGRTLVFRLDGAGKVVAIDGRDAVWAAFCQGIVALVMREAESPKARRAANAERLVAPLRALPPARQQAMLGSLVESLVAEEAGEAPGVRKLRLPGGSPFGAGLTLDGTRTLTVAGAMLRSVTVAEAPRGTGAPGHVSLERVREIDPVTGLIAETTETARTRVSEGPSARTDKRVTTVRVTRAATSDWPSDR